MSGANFTVNSSAQQLYPGWQDTVTLINNGPSSVWIDSSSSINLITSYRLRPNTTVTWSRKTPLWAMTEPEQTIDNYYAPADQVLGATISVMEGVMMSADNIPLSRRMVTLPDTTYTMTEFSKPFFRKFFETSSFRHLRIQLKPKADTNALNIAYRMTVIYWSDVKEAMGSDEYIFNYSKYVSSVETAPHVFVIPTHGVYTSVQIKPVAPAPTINTYGFAYLRIDGHSEPAEPKMYVRGTVGGGVSLEGGQGWQIYPDTSFTQSPVTTTSSATVIKWNGGKLYLPSLGTRMRWYVTFYTLPPASKINLIETTGVYVSSLAFPSAFTPIDTTVSVSRSMGYSLEVEGAVIDANLSIVWSD